MTSVTEGSRAHTDKSSEARSLVKDGDSRGEDSDELISDSCSPFGQTPALMAL